ncbi:hypothetical protein Droror1_Dr00027198 [Drosera rotundifolia]
MPAPLQNIECNVLKLFRPIQTSTHPPDQPTVSTLLRRQLLLEPAALKTSSTKFKTPVSFQLINTNEILNNGRNQPVSSFDNLPCSHSAIPTNIPTRATCSTISNTKTPNSSIEFTQPAVNPNPGQTQIQTLDNPKQDCHHQHPHSVSRSNSTNSNTHEVEQPSFLTNKTQIW